MKGLAALILAGLLGVGLGQCMSAKAHEPYTGLTNPVTGASCCNSGDCKPVDVREIGESGSDYTWRGSYFPKRQSQPSPDEQFHVCAYPEHHFSGSTKWIVRCLLRPTPGS